MKTIDMVNCKKCTIYIKDKTQLITVENCDEPKLILFQPTVASKPRIVSSKTGNFQIDVQKENKEDSDWKSLSIPQQLQTAIDPNNFRVNNTLIQL